MKRIPCGNERELPAGQPEAAIPASLAPYGVCDVTKNDGWVSVGTDNDTSAFAAQSIRRWWESMGANAYPEAARLLITADSGGSNGARVRLWKVELQKLADETGLEISVLSPAARNQQAEQNRAPDVFVHPSELARQTAGKSPR